MSSTIFFFLFIPLLAFILLAVNLIFAPHNSYMEKNSAFECGFSSFLGQNRTQFSISFFIFALLFLLFDLEILLVYPYLVSAYTNEIYGLTILLLFLLALTLGFAFELGKKALYIDSRQMSNTSTNKSNYISKLSGNTNSHLHLHNSKRSFSTYNEKVYYENIKSIISFIRFSIDFIKHIVFIIRSPFNFIQISIYNNIISTLSHAFVSNLSYTYYKDIYDKKGVFALLFVLTDSIYDSTISFKRDHTLNLFTFHVICFYSMLYINYYLFLTVLLINTIILLPFIIITLFKHTFLINKKLQPLQFLVCILLGLILFIVFICLLFLLIKSVWPVLKSYFLLTGNNNGNGNNGSGNNGSGNNNNDPGSNGNPGPEGGTGHNSGPEPKRKRKRNDTPPYSDTDKNRELTEDEKIRLNYPIFFTSRSLPKVPQESYENKVPQESYENKDPEESYENKDPEESYESQDSEESYESQLPEESYESKEEYMKRMSSKRNRVWRAENQDHIRKTRREHYVKNKNEILKKKREHYINNKERILETQRQYYLKKKQEKA